MNKILPLFLGFGIIAGAGVFAALALIIPTHKIPTQALIYSIIREETYTNSHLYNVPPPPEKTKDDFKREWK